MKTGQIHAWLNRGTRDGFVTKLNRPVSYQTTRQQPQEEHAIAVEECLYRYFLNALKAITGQDPLPLDSIVERLQISKAQGTAWLKAGIQEGVVTRLTRPERYSC